MSAMIDTALWLRWLPVWKRNFLVWRKLLKSAIIGNIGEPMLYLLALGYGMGQLLGDIGGVPYMSYLASGMVCASIMNTTSFEAMYSAYTRMAVQGTWLGMLTTPLGLTDILIGESLWAATKGVISAVAIVLVAIVLGLVSDARVIWVLPVAVIAGVCFSSMALIVTAFARNYDFFLFYFTLLITPMMLLSGVFFPIDSMPSAIQLGAQVLPLYHAIALIRPLMLGGVPQDIALHVGVLLAYTLLCMPVALRLIHRRIMK